MLKEKIVFPLSVFKELLDGVVAKYPHNSLGDNVQKTAAEVLEQGRELAQYSIDNPRVVEAAITDKKASLTVPGVDPKLMQYLQKILGAINDYKTGAVASNVAWIIDYGIWFQSLGGGLSFGFARNIATRVIMKLLSYVFTAPPLNRDEYNKLSAVVRSALDIAVEKGITDNIFDLLGVAKQCKQLSWEDLLKQGMPIIIKMIEIFETDVVGEWKLQPTVENILRSSQ